MTNVDLIHQLIRKDLTAEGWNQEDIELAIAECVQERIETGANDNTICTKEMSYLKKDSLQIVAIVIGKNKSSISSENLANTSKHWLGKFMNFIKKVFSWIKNIMVKFFNCLLKFFKRIWKYLIGLIILGALIGGAVAAYNYYENDYLPQKRMEQLKRDLASKEGESQVQLALRVITRNSDWSDYNIEAYQLDTDIKNDAFKIIADKASKGDSYCQVLLGHFFLFGEDTYYVNTDYEKSTYWYQEAVKAGNINAYNNLGLAYKEGRGVKVDMRKAVDYLKKGAELGEDYAQANYGDLFIEGVKIKVGSHKETRSTSNYYGGDQKIREYYDYNKMDLITVYYEDVDDYETLVPKDIEQAKSWWRKAAAQGNKHANERLQKVYN